MSVRQIISRIGGAIALCAVVIGAVAWAASRDADGPASYIVIAALSIVAAVFLVGMAGISRWYNWSAPVREIERAAHRMASGDWTVRVEPHGADGLRQLAANLNLLGAQAQKQLAELHAQRGGLQALVDTLPDPIVAADAQGRIILLNAPAAHLLQLTLNQAMNQKIVNVVNDEQIVELYESIHRAADTTPATPISRELRLARDAHRITFQAVAMRTVGGGALLVLRDVTRLTGAVQMKTDFVANASHELRTPIAAIKIAFETLRDVYREDPVQLERCIVVIDGHLRRLEEMLRDLLDLSRVESPEPRPHVGPVHTTELMALLKTTMGAFARQKNVELRLAENDSSTPAEFFSDGRLLNLLLKNLVENSIKFTPPGGRVTVAISELAPVPGSVEGEPGHVVIAVSDTGIGIAPEHLDRVFERFYQVDPARSGSAGRGTGLGLAIVKHAAHALNGVVKIDSQVGAGTTVTCEFPQLRPSEEQLTEA